MAVFVGALLWSVRGNLSGAATGTGSANADRRGVDRIANAFVPVALAYLLTGSYAMAATASGSTASSGASSPEPPASRSGSGSSTTG
ncbi:MAG: hypothetical protein ABEH88_05730 [Halobacteriales archaeon]